MKDYTSVLFGWDFFTAEQIQPEGCLDVPGQQVRITGDRINGLVILTWPMAKRLQLFGITYI